MNEIMAETYGERKRDKLLISFSGGKSSAYMTDRICREPEFKPFIDDFDYGPRLEEEPVGCGCSAEFLQTDMYLKAK